MKIELTNLSCSLLAQCLALPGWGKNDNQVEAVRRVYLAGKILSEVIPTINAEQPKAKLNFEMEDKMVEICRIALKHFIANGNTPSGAGMNELIEQFKLLET